MNPRATLLIIAALVVLSLAGVVPGQVAPPNQNLVVFFTGDTEGEITSCGCPKLDLGGMTRKAAFVDTLRGAGWDFAFVDAGGLAPFSDLDLQTRIKVEALCRTMATMSYDGVTLGHHDLALGPDFVTEIVGWLEQPVLATNYSLNLEEGLQDRSRVVEVRGWRVGLLGFLDPELVTDDHDWLTVEPWEDQGDRVEELAARCDLVVALASVASAERMTDLATAQPGIHLVLGTHRGDLTPDLAQVAQRNWVMGFSGKGRYVGKAEFEFDTADNVANAKGSFLPVVEFWGRRPVVDDIVRGYYRDLRSLITSDEFLEEREKNLKDSPVRFVGTAACVDCHENQYAQWQETGHARAKETLEAEDQDQVPECQSCHTTGFGFRSGFVTPSTSPERWQVGCESCHGAGAAHLEDNEAPYGEILVDACLTCHTDHDSPEFNYETYLPKVTH